ncbi:MAG TPA: MFS transporter [Chloroflexia bacterium]|nr:MFS transporter [Chloroflexia bacterium]
MSAATPTSRQLGQPGRIRTSWVWLLTLFTVASFIEVIFWSQVQAFTPLYLRSLGVADADRDSWTGVIAAVSSAIGIPFLPFWGALADRYARQPIIVRSFVAHMLTGVLVILSPNIWVFLVARAIQSLSLGNSGLMMTTLSERMPANRLGLGFGVLNGAAPLGLFIGPLIGGPIVDGWGFSVLLIVDVALLLAVILTLTFGYRDGFKGTDRGSLLRMAWASIGIIAKSSRLRLLFPALFLLFAGWMLAFTYVPLVIERLYHGDEAVLATTIGLVAGSGGLATLFISPLLGALGDRFGHWRVLFTAAAVSVVLWPWPMLANDLGTFTLFWAVISGLSSAIFALSFTVLSSSTPSEVRGRVMTFSYLPVNVGYAVGPAIGSIITPWNIFAVFPAAAVITAMGIAALAVATRQSVDTVADEAALTQVETHPV